MAALLVPHASKLSHFNAMVVSSHEGTRYTYKSLRVKQFVDPAFAGYPHAWRLQCFSSIFFTLSVNRSFKRYKKVAKFPTNWGQGGKRVVYNLKENFN